MAKFFNIDPRVIESYLAARGFTRGVQYREVVYVKRSTRNPDVQVKVYTSIRVGSAQVRGSGKDAIRVCVVFDDGRRSFGIGKFPPVLRVDSEASIISRIDERVRAAAKRATEWLDANCGPRPVPAPRPQADVDAEEAYMNKIVADAERASEIRGFASDPDYRDFLKDVELEEVRGEVPPDWLCDPCSEPPQSLEP